MTGHVSSVECIPNIGERVRVPRSNERCQVSYQARPVTVQEMLQNGAPRQAAKFVQSEVPRRLAISAQMIESLSGWSDVPELVQVYQCLSRWSKALRTTKRSQAVGLRPFTQCVQSIRREGRNTMVLIVRGVHQLGYDMQFMADWLDEFLLVRIGYNTLMQQYASRVGRMDGGEGRPIGVLDQHCNVRVECLKAASLVSDICRKQTGGTPKFTFQNFVAEETEPCPDQGCIFTYFPSYLSYVLMELLKNSFKATVESGSLETKPIHIRAVSNDKSLTIRIIDTAGGIPSEIGNQIWSYGCGAVAKSCSDTQAAPPTPLAGYGVGLPMARLFARYLSGNLEVKSSLGYGTEALIHLPRLPCDQSEIVPLV